MNNLKTSLNKILPWALVSTYLIHYLLNFTSSPYVLYSFIVITFLTLLSGLTLKLSNFLIVLMGYSFVEGQGRILLGYHFIFRIIFDAFNTFFIVRMIKRTKKLVAFDEIPRIFIAIFVLHTLWFFLNLFNPTGASPVYAIAALKYYILPFLFFFSLLSIDEFRDVKYLNKISNSIVGLVLLTCLLCIYQMHVGENSLYGMSNNYSSLFKKYELFKGFFFRPWGTSHEAGGMSVMLTLSLGFVILYLKGKNKFRDYLIFAIIIGLSWFTLFISQVRSAFIKHSLILIGFSVFTYLFAKNRKRIAFITSVFAATFILGIFAFGPKVSIDAKNSTFEFATKRFLSIFDPSVTRSRGSAELIFWRIKNQTHWPFGYGPGMVTNFLPQIEERRNELAWLDKVFLWSGDNFFLFAFLELGLGAFFYLALFILAPLTILYRMWRMDRARYRGQFQLAVLSFIILNVLIVGNWGAVGLAFNPESFFFWIWTAIGWKSSSKCFQKSTSSESVF